MWIRKIVAPLLLALLVLGVGYGLWKSHSETSTAGRATAIETVRGLIGSEKESFLTNPQVQEILRSHQITLEVEKAGSRQIVQRTDLKNYDFGYPSGQPSAVRLQQMVRAGETFTTFYTPMVIASWAKLIPPLEKAGIVEKRAGVVYVVDMERLLKMMEQGTRWKDLQGNKDFAVGKSILINTTDLRTSNSAAMFLALMSYIANSSNVVQSNAEASKVLPMLMPIFLKQGYQELSSAGPFDDYLSMGMGKAPMVMIYESQFIEHLLHTPQRDPEMVMLYPEPTLFAKHILVPFNEKGKKLGQLLATDPQLQAIASRYGYRTSNAELFTRTTQPLGGGIPATLTNVIDPPTHEMMERMISAIEAQLN